MCGYSSAKIRDEKVHLGIGYYGGNLEIGNDSYKVDPGKASTMTKERTKMKEKLESYSKAELAEMILEFVDNADE